MLFGTVTLRPICIIPTDFKFHDERRVETYFSLHISKMSTTQETGVDLPLGVIWNSTASHVVYISIGVSPGLKVLLILSHGVLEIVYHTAAGYKLSEPGTIPMQKRARM